MPVTGKSPGMISRRETRTGRRTTNSVGTARGARGASIAPVGSARAAPVGSTRTATDVFEVVADGNADMLQEMIDFSGAKHLCELRSKKREDYGQNLLHCAVANGQLKTLEVLLRGKVFDPNQVDSVYTRSTPMMEAVKLGRLDLVESLLRAGGRLDIQDVNGDTVLHWAAREVSAAFLRQVLHLARKSGARTEELVAALQVGNNNGEMPADACTNDLARESIRRIASGEETPGVAPKKGKAADLPPRAHPSGAGGQTSSHASPKGTPGLRRPGSATEAGEAESGGGVAVRRRSLSSVVSPGPVPRGTEEGDPRGVASAGVNSTTVEKAGKGEHVKEQHGGSLGEEGLPVSKPSSLLRR